MLEPPAINKKMYHIVFILLSFAVFIVSGWNSCKNVENGVMTGSLFPETVIMNITSILDLSCICQSVTVGELMMEEFMGVRGALIPGDCGALRFAARVSATLAYYLENIFLTFAR